MKKLLVALSTLIAMGATPAFAQGSRQEAQIFTPDDFRHIYDEWGFAPAIRLDNGTVYLSGVIVPLMGDGSYEERYVAGLRLTFARIDEILHLAGGSLDDIIEITSFHMDLPAQVTPMAMLRKELMNAPHPAWTAIGTTALAIPDGQTEIKIIAYIPNPKK